MVRVVRLEDLSRHWHRHLAVQVVSWQTAPSIPTDPFTLPPSHLPLPFPTSGRGVCSGGCRGWAGRIGCGVGGGLTQRSTATRAHFHRDSVPQLAPRCLGSPCWEAGSLGPPPTVLFPWSGAGFCPLLPPTVTDPSSFSSPHCHLWCRDCLVGILSGHAQEVGGRRVAGLPAGPLQPGSSSRPCCHHHLPTLSSAHMPSFPVSAHLPSLSMYPACPGREGLKTSCGVVTLLALGSGHRGHARVSWVPMLEEIWAPEVGTLGALAGPGHHCVLFSAPVLPGLCLCAHMCTLFPHASPVWAGEPCAADISLWPGRSSGPCLCWAQALPFW